MKKVLPIILLIIISAFLIFFRSDIPKYLSFDEVEFTKLALSLNNKPYIPYSQLATGHSTLYFYILLSSLKTFGINTFALRFPAAIFGILSIVFFYLIVKKIFHQFNNITVNALLPFFLALILLTSRWFLNFSRFSFEATFLLFLELISIYFLISFWQNKKYQNIFLIVSGLFAGLAFLSYTPGRIFFLLPLSFIILPFPRRQESSVYGSPIRSGMIHILLFLIPFVIIITPLSNYLINNKDIRVDQQFFLKNNEMTVAEKASGLWKNISSTSLMFLVKGDMNGRHNYPSKPALNPILGILFIVGLIISIKNYKNFYNNFFLIYFFISLFPALMTYPWENPNMLRTYTVLPSVIYFIGNSIYYLRTIVTRLSLNNKLKYPILVSFYLILIFSCVYELRTYFKYQSTVFNQAFEIKLPLDKAIKVKFNP